MKFKKKFLYIIGALLVLAPAIALTCYYFSTLEARNLAKRIAVEAVSAAAYENILNSFTSPEGVVTYPENYAGAYLDEKGKLVIMIAASGKDAFDAAALEMAGLPGPGNGNEITFKEAEYAYPFLLGLMDNLYSLFLENHSDPDSVWSFVTGLFLRDDKNKICVEITELDNEKAKRFLAGTSAPGAIEFMHSDKINMSEELEAYDYHAGMRANGGSIGFRARKGDMFGFVTTGHTTITGAPVLQAINIGTCIESITDFTLDAAFVMASEQCIMSDRTYRGQVIEGINKTPILGATVFKVGRSTGLTHGRITSTNAAYLYTLYNGHVKIIRTNVITADYLSRAGDSGCIVFDSKNRLLGIHLAGPVSERSGDRAVEKASTIEEVLGVTFY